MPLYFTRLTETAQRQTRATEGAAGLDLYADETITIPEYRRAWVSTGIAVAIAPGYCGQVWPRSGLAGKGIQPARGDTSAGVIDCDYRGELKVLLCNGSHERKTVKAGDRIAQLLIVPVGMPNVIEVDALPPTARGENGFGSSGT